MTTKKAKYALLTTFVLLFSGCHEVKEGTIEFEMLTSEKQVILSNEELSPKCSVSLKMAKAREEYGEAAQAINNTVTERLLKISDTEMKQAMEQFTNEYTKAYKERLLPLYNQDRADTTKRAWYEYHYIISCETQQGSKGTVAYLATVDYFEGGAHGNHQLETMNFDVKTGRLLALKDIFTPGYEHQLNNLLLKALKEKEGVKTLAELKEKGYLNAMDIFTPQNFILGDETITFVYNPYEIAPYSVGETEIVISYSAIENILSHTFTH